MEKRTYQFKAGADGWNKASGLLIFSITHETAIKICYSYSLLFGTVARCANVTGYEDLQERNERGETLGNGCYCHPEDAPRILSEKIEHGE